MNRSFIFSLIILAASCGPDDQFFRRNYYVDAEKGNDSNSGRTAEKPFKTLERLQNFNVGPGDSILLKGGQRHNGSVVLKGLHGTVAHRITLTSYGPGKAVIESGDSTAIHLLSCSQIEVNRLHLTGSGRLGGNKGDGILFTDVHYGSIDSVEVHDFLLSGIHVRGGGNIRITRVLARENGFSGIYAESGESAYGIDGSSFRTLRQVYIGYSIADNNPGCPVITDNHSGNGILMAGVVKGTIEYCEAMNNGWDMPREGNGPVGIWAYMSDSVLIQHCYSHHNRTSTKGKDGGGFDLDGGVRFSTVQYNLSAFNEGAGFGMFQYAGATEWTDNIVRFNISYNDGRKNGKAGIFMWCDPIALPMKNLRVYHNTMVGPGLAVNFDPGEYNGFRFENNLFQITAPVTRFVGGKYSGVVFRHNLWWAGQCCNDSYGQPGVHEDPQAISADPCLVLPAADLPAELNALTLDELPYFRISSRSAAKGRAMVMNNIGDRDFWGLLIAGIPNQGAFQH
jgi:hypothetical protein